LLGIDLKICSGLGRPARWNFLLKPALVVGLGSYFASARFFKIFYVIIRIAMRSLEKSLPIDSVCKMPGPRSIKTTQIFAKVTDRKISEGRGRLLEHEEDF
jgi:hypothetical protein